MANHSRAGCIHSIAAPAATNEPASPPAGMPVRNTTTANRVRARREERSGLRTYHPRIAVAQAAAAATMHEIRRRSVVLETVRPSEENGAPARTSRMASCVSSERSEVTRSHAVRSTTTEENMTMPEARLTWGGRFLVGWLTRPVSQVPPNSPHPRPDPVLLALRAGFLRVVLRDRRGAVPDARSGPARRGLDP